MCRSKAEGGRRCAFHIKQNLSKAEAKHEEWSARAEDRRETANEAARKAELVEQASAALPALAEAERQARTRHEAALAASPRNPDEVAAAAQALQEARDNSADARARLARYKNLPPTHIANRAARDAEQARDRAAERLARYTAELEAAGDGAPEGREHYAHARSHLDVKPQGGRREDPEPPFILAMSNTEEAALLHRRRDLGWKGTTAGLVLHLAIGGDGGPDYETAIHTEQNSEIRGVPGRHPAFTNGNREFRHSVGLHGRGRYMFRDYFTEMSRYYGLRPEEYARRVATNTALNSHLNDRSPLANSYREARAQKATNEVGLTGSKDDVPPEKPWLFGQHEHNALRTLTLNKLREKYGDEAVAEVFAAHGVSDLPREHAWLPDDE